MTGVRTGSTETQNNAQVIQQPGAPAALTRYSLYPIPNRIKS
jgi:hypothetical protein